MGMARDLGGYLSRYDMQMVRMQEYNALATQDLLLFRTYIEWAFGYPTAEYGDMMLELTNRMAAQGGVMAGMTPETLLAILGRSVTIPPAFKTVAAISAVPTLQPLELAAWSYIHIEPGFRYTSVETLPGQLTTPLAVPAFDRLVEPYRSLALLAYDLQVAAELRRQDIQAAEAYSTTQPLEPPGWYRLSEVYQIQEQHRQRMGAIRQQIVGTSPAAREAMIGLVNSYIFNF
jgi:hypothetical protein